MASTEASNLTQGQDAHPRLDPLRIRSNSFANDGVLIGSPSYTAYLTSPSAVSPEPVFIAASAASQIVTNDHDHQANTWFEQYGIEPSGEAAVVTPGALKLVNGFLDQLLFSFIAASKSTSLIALRPAVVEILKPKLAKDAITGADQELHDYLGAGEDEELLSFPVDDVGPNATWDPETVWKRTRLRCMVYSSLGDMEEEDEDYHIEQQQSTESPTSRRYSKASFVVSPAVAIFLTSILEFMGEQALVFAGQQAYHRLRTKREKEGSGPSTPIEIADRVVVEELDMDKVALDRTLGRLWRGWRKRLRSPTMVSPRSISRDSFRSRSNSSSVRTPIDRDARRPSIMEIMDQDHAAAIPLPISEDDVREIEIPGLVYRSESDAHPKEDEKRRPKSMLLIGPRWEERLTPNDSVPVTPILQFAEPRKRSNSLPTPLPSPLDKAFQEQDEPGVEVIEPAQEAEKVQESTKEPATDHDDAPESSSTVPPKGEEEHYPDESKEGHSAGSILLPQDANIGENSPEERPMSKDSDVVEQYFVEQPKIMTSHRVSMGGIVPDSPLSPRPTSVRSLSVHSIRLIDVPSRSPARLSENNTPTLRSPSGSPFPRNKSGSSSKDDRNSSDSIAELVEPDSTTPESTYAAPKLGSPEADDDSATPTQGAIEGSTAPVSPEMKSTSVAPAPAISTRAAVQVPVEPVETKPTFVLAPAPATQRRVVNGGTVPDTRETTHEPLLSARGPGTGDSGVPPLTPLREMMEGAADTSDEASSIAPSNDSRSLSETRIKGHTSSVSAASLPRRPVPAEKSSYRARNDSVQKTTNEAVNRSKRSISQSSSATSHSLKLKPIRTSSDFGEDGKGKSFDELIRSDETLQYTLTPQNMREIEVSSNVKAPSGASIKRDIQSPDSPLRTPNPPSTRNESSNGSTPPRPNTGKSYGSVNKHTGLHSNPPSEPPMPRPFQPFARPVSNTSSRVRPGAPQARDARDERDSIGDFADFIRSTGPAGLSQPPRSSPASSGRSARTGITRNASASFSRSSGTTPIRRSESSAGRTRLMAREAVVPHSDNNSDLIDFIRQGPPSESPRIPRTVAPFRTTMDSDQMAGAIGPRAFELALPDARNSQTSTNIPESMHSSVNSQSALLNGSNRRTVVPARSHSDFEEEDMMPKRKTRRVRDPYAIDFSDEEEEELFAVPSKKPQRQEESLIDFLNNVPPPPSTPTTETSIKSKGHIKKKPSRGLMSRFTRTNSNTTPDPSPPNYPRASTGSRPATNTPQTPYRTPHSVRSGTAHSSVSTIRQTPRPHTNSNAEQSSQPAQHQPEKPKSYQPARGNYVSQLDTERKPPSTASANGTRVMQRSYQPREARQASEGTNDLAAFLMSAPPPSTGREVPPEPFLLNQDNNSGGGSFSRMFRKKGRVM